MARTTIPARKHVTRLTVACLVLLSLIGTGCSADPSVRAQDGFAIDLAQQLPAPDPDLPFRVVFTDYEQAMNDLGIREPGSCDGSAEDRELYREQLIEALLTLRVMSPEMISLLVEGNEPDELHARFGLGWCDINTASNFPHEAFDIGGNDFMVTVDAPLREIEEAVNADELWNDRLETESIDGGLVFDWGDEGSRNFSLLRRLGVGGSLVASENGTVAFARDRARIDQVIDRDTDRLIDVDGVQAVLEELTVAGSYSIRIGESFLTAEMLRESGARQGLGFEPLVPWTLFGVGIGIGADSDESVLHLALEHESGADAQANAGRLRFNLAETESEPGIPWSDIYQVVSIDVDDTMLTAALVVSADEYVSLRAGSFVADLLLPES